ncbi:CbtA family protein [Halopiger djelfimassiliensis]|uniref:CbtA family protein n=1 Tax=Halopiger djelfimassiliensis TaxID=1293047 RepID=UPI000677BDF6|nr:CbtA family protein [Halopiger djelfimassiliensis]
MLLDYLQRGVLAGVLAGLAYGLYVALVANPLVDYMETVAKGGEHGHTAGEHVHAAGEHAHAVSETTTAVVSVGSAILWGILLGGVFALAVYFLEPALPGRDPINAYVLAGSGYFTVSVAPWLVLPPTTPGAEQAGDPTTRIVIYIGMMVVGAVVATASVLGYRRVASRSRPLGLLTAAVPLVSLGLLAAFVAPTIVETGTLPADLVTAFRGLTALSQAALWVLVAGLFNWLGARPALGSTTERHDGALTNP